MFIRKKNFRLMGLVITFFMASGIYTSSPCIATELNSSTSNTNVKIGETQSKDFQRNIPSLAATYKDYFTIGTAVLPNQLDSSNIQSEFIKYHYNEIVAGNCMKMDATEPTENNFKFDDADKLLAYTQANNMKLRGHTLVWHSQVPAWFFQDKNDASKPASRDLLLSRMKNHIQNVAGRYAGKIDSWDVVNEVISDSNGLRDDSGNSKYKSIIGDVDGDGFDSDYIELAFKYAREADPKAKLIINDYGMEGSTRKRDDMYNLIKRLLEKGVPIDGVGLQMHISMYSPSSQQVKDCIEKFATLKSIKPNFDIQITEADMSIYNGNEPTKEITDDVYLQQATQYKKLFEVFKEEAVKKNISTVMMWGEADCDTWLDNHPVKGRKDAPLFFDRNLQAKPAYWAVVDPSKVKGVFRQSVNTPKTTIAIGAAADAKWATLSSFDADNYVVGKNGAIASIKTAYDNDNLYVLADVKDSTVGNKDSIDIFVDQTGSKVEKYSATRTTNTGTIKTIAKADGYQVQFKIPFSGFTPAIGSKLAFDIKINDSVSNGQIASSAVWNDFSNKQNIDSSKYGYLVLDADNKVLETKYGIPTIDGDIDSVWNLASSVETNVLVEGKAGAKATVKTLWADSYVYVLYQVKDSILDKTSKDDYQQDSVEAFLDENNSRGETYDADDVQYRVNYENKQSFNGKCDKANFKSSAKTNGDGYVVEMAIPLKIPGVADKIMGFDAQVNDGTAGKRTGVLSWCDKSGKGYATMAKIGNIKLLALAGK